MQITKKFPLRDSFVLDRYNMMKYAKFSLPIKRKPLVKSFEEKKT